MGTIKRRKIKNIDTRDKDFFPTFNNPYYHKETWKDHIKSVLGIVFIIVFLVLAVSSCIKLAEDQHKESILRYEQSMFKKGDIVKAKVSGQTGQVISLDCYTKCYYDVRFNAVNTRTNTHIINRDGFMENFPIIMIRGMEEFELEKIK